VEQVSVLLYFRYAPRRVDCSKCGVRVEQMPWASGRRHRPLLLNWFRAKGRLSSAVVEGFNNKAKLTTRKAFGFRT
jgi:Transposase